MTLVCSSVINRHILQNQRHVSILHLSVLQIHPVLKRWMLVIKRSPILLDMSEGQECAGIVTSNGASPPTYTTHKGMGLVSTAFLPEALTKLHYGNLGICHTRYSTTGISELQNCQPFVVDTLHDKIAVAHNGELVNAHALRKKVMRHGVGLSTSSDSELITQLLALTPPMEELDSPDRVARIKNLMTETPTSYSLLVMFKDVVYAVRDPYGNRPLCIGQLVPISKLHSPGAKEEDTDGWVVSSESCSFQSIGAKYYREVLPGERVQISRHGVTAELAIESPTDTDVVSTVTESATPAALGYVQQVHIRVASPPIRFPCYMGINIPTKEELIANKPEFEDIAGYIGADSVKYLTVEGLVSAVQEGIACHNEKDQMNNKSNRKVGHCTACLTGKYPVELE
ncbi:unnamed protein product [Oreochromis niloticus]|nr:unnamed protein product [Mustela putorius furo]